MQTLLSVLKHLTLEAVPVFVCLFAFVFVADPNSNCRLTFVFTNH